ncbi:MAG: hypothetical protein ACI91J_003105, partial [Yoonia sp.]
DMVAQKIMQAASTPSSIIDLRNEEGNCAVRFQPLSNLSGTCSILPGKFVVPVRIVPLDCGRTKVIPRSVRDFY